MPAALLLTGRVEGGTQVSGKVILLEHFRNLRQGARWFNCGQTDALYECYAFAVLATCLAGFDEILTLQWGASRTRRPFHLEWTFRPPRPSAYRTSDFQLSVMNKRH